MAIEKNKTINGSFRIKEENNKLIKLFLEINTLSNMSEAINEIVESHQDVEEWKTLLKKQEARKAKKKTKKKR
jgi:hypothetical protein